MTDRAAPRRIQLAEQRRVGFRVALDSETGDWLELMSTARGEFVASGDPAAAGLRPIARDLDYFGLLHDDPPHPALALLARAAFGDLGRRLMGLEGSSAAYLAANITGGPGRLDLGVDAQVTLPRAPLDLVLRMTGIDGTVISLTGGRSFRLQLPGAG
jgi:hypothetical protein